MVKPGYKQTEIGVIPDDWKVTLLPNALTPSKEAIKIGPFGSQLKKEFLSREGYKVYGQENVYQNNYLIGTRFISTSRFNKLKSCEIKLGDFLISMMGTVGKCSIVPKNILPGIMDSHLLRLRVDKNKINSIFLLFLFQSKVILSQVKSLLVGGIMEGLSSKIIRNLIIPLTTFNEQQAIAEALSDVDGLIESLEMLIEKKRAIKLATMQQLLTGQTRLPGYSGNWIKKKLSGQIDLLTGYPFPSSYYSKEGTRLLRGSNIKRGLIDWDQGRTAFWSDITPDLQKYILKKRDVVVAMDGSLVGRSFAQLGKHDLPALLLQRVARIRSESLEIDYIKHWVCSSMFTSYCDIVKTNTAIPHISPSDIMNFEIYLPISLKEQQAIAKVLSDMDDEIDALERRLEKTKNLKLGMMQELLTGRTRLI